MNPSEVGDLVARVQSCDLEPGETGYLVSAKFVQKLEQMKPGEGNLPKLSNSDLRSNGTVKSSLKLGQDYYIVSYLLWSEIQFNFGGGPEITCGIMPDGTPELSLRQINVKFGQKSRDMKCSRATLVKDFLSMLVTEFELRDSHWELFPVHCLKPICAEGTVGEQLVGQNVLEIRSSRTGHQDRQMEVMGTHKHQTVGVPALQVRVVAHHDVATVKFSQSKMPSGLRNLGNSCYMNASLQALMSVEQFTDKIQDVVAQADRPRLTPVLLRLFQEMSEPGKVVSPQYFKTGIAAILPFLQGATQEDAHEFTTFLLDILKYECSSKEGAVSSMFFGNLENITICANCNAPSVINEVFSSISIPVAESRRVIFSPYDLTQPMQRLCGLPEVPSILIGTRQDGTNKITETLSPEFGSIVVLEKPPLDEGVGLVITRIVNQAKEKLTYPFLMKVPLNVEVSEEELIRLVEERIRPLSPSKFKNIQLVAPPKSFKVSEGTTHCSESVAVMISQKVSDIRMVSQTGPIPVSELVERYFSEVVLDVDNQWKCGECQKESCAFHRISLLKAPQVMIIQLKRFRMRGKSLSRDDSDVIVPMTLNLSKFFKDGVVGTAQYELRALVNHSGSLAGGHYTANGRRGDTWYYFNDASVCERAAPIGGSSAPYIMYYQRIQ